MINIRTASFGNASKVEQKVVNIEKCLMELLMMGNPHAPETSFSPTNLPHTISLPASHSAIQEVTPASSPLTAGKQLRRFSNIIYHKM